MALSTLEQGVVGRAIAAAQQIVTQLKPALDRLNVDYNGSVNAKNTITQQNLDLEPRFSGLTKAQLDDGLYALTATLLTDVGNAFAQLEQLAARAG